MSSPAERYARSRAKGASKHPRLAEMAATFDFPLDDFQERACGALEEGRSVLVAAPTGAGKTVVGEFAVFLALASGGKTFYTTPIKALSNQKYNDLSSRYGSANVGLLTGDSSINGEAPIVVMTTEVLRNMMYAGSDTLRGLQYVVMDEVHYLADRSRGAVWEEVIIHLPGDVLVVALSATVSNAEEFGDWLGTVRGETEVVVEEHRPVPLWQHMLVGPALFDLFVDSTSDVPVRSERHERHEKRGEGAKRGKGGRGDSAAPERPDVSRFEGAVVNPDLLEAIRSTRATTDRRGRLEDAGAPRGRRGRQARGRGGAGRYHDMQRDLRNGRDSNWGDRRSSDGSGSGTGRSFQGRPGQASRAQVIDRLDREGLLPAITFIFSRVGCDAAVTQLLQHGTRLTTASEADQIREIVERRVASLAAEDLSVLHYWEFLEAAQRGFAAHHAGMLPTFREIVEELFVGGWIRAVFATETLALGVNMPARTVVIEKLVKFNGETHADITPAEYTQLTGRAGRRGIDIEGHAVVLWNPRVDPLAVGGLASTRTYPLRSSFRPTYNMAVNLVAQFGRERARDILETSFAQFQADRAVVGLSRQVREHEEALAGYAEAMACHLGDFEEYAALRHELGRLEKDAAKQRGMRERVATAESLDALRPGDVVLVPIGRRTEKCVVVPVGRDGTITVVTEDARLRTLDAEELREAVVPIGHVRLGKRINYRNPKARRDLASTVRAQVRDVPPGHDERTRAAQTGNGSSGGGDRTGGKHGAHARKRAGVDSDVEARVSALRKQIKAHPCHGCNDREHHARWAERWWRLERETRRLRGRVEGRTNSVARVFDRTCAVLTGLGYLDDDGGRVTDAGKRLARIYTERDLLTAECLREGVWEGLDAAGLAAAVSCLVNEPRNEERESSPRAGGIRLATAHDEMVRLWSAIDDTEESHDLPRTPYPDPGIAHLVHAWARGQRLDTVLSETELAAGDFVRRCKQVVDLLDQIAVATGSPQMAATARAAVDAIMRGVVAADRLD
ncbi:MAG: DEAD/DEAH box helicase [Dermatophilus congolensis]|nr:DEAD/DEAH box helicase [Dermatophilus congolensis]